jgi:hypothetical protein
MLSRFVYPDYFCSIRSLPAPLPYPVCVRPVCSAPPSQVVHEMNKFHSLRFTRRPPKQGNHVFLAHFATSHAAPLHFCTPLRYRTCYHYDRFYHYTNCPGRREMEPNDVEMIMESVELQSVEPEPKLYRLVGEGLGGTFVWPDEYV